jgi:hypothetical protein
MTKIQILDWLRTEFLPLPLATEERALLQFIENALRYFNTHSAFPHFEMIENVTPDQHMIQCSGSFGTIAQVYPATQNMWVLQNYPMWSLLGVSVLDNVTSDLIQMYSAYQSYATYIGMDFRWSEVAPDDSSLGPKLYLSNIPVNATSLCVVGSRRFVGTENIKAEWVLNWVLSYVKALAKMAEGNILRKSQIIDVKNDGSDLMSEGKEEKTKLEQDLAEEGRWLAFGKRI